MLNCNFEGVFFSVWEACHNKSAALRVTKSLFFITSEMEEMNQRPYCFEADNNINCNEAISH